MAINKMITLKWQQVLSVLPNCAVLTGKKCYFLPKSPDKDKSLPVT